ncbi:MAG: site-specific tyrosine recombinase/integron integrase [Psychroserpens sp.]|uniref:site-specific tyrosine recombinase/integron integrase n=1 Tax=Psychroserpens sp. TaxID=2020870 RepID=UPI00300275CD
MTGLATIQIDQLHIHRIPYITVQFKYNSAFVKTIKKVPSARWSQSKKVWIIDDTEAHLNQIRDLFKAISYINDQGYFSKKKKRNLKLNEDQKVMLNQFHKYLKGKRYSKSTLRTYVFSVADFIAYYTLKSLETLDNRDVELYIEDVFINRNYSVSTQRQFISALKLFTQFNTDTQIKELELTRPQNSRLLPVVLSQQEIIRLLQKTSNLKHRTIIALLYSCGLRISELLNLHISDIDANRRQLHVRNSKGRKDRYVGLADSFIPLFSNYMQTYEPQLYFVENNNQLPYSAESVRAFLKRNCKKAGITKRVTPHTLRHSYATHMLENGVNIRYIQTLLGHSRPETTMIYTHIRRQDLLEISNPLDVAIYKLDTTDKQMANVVLTRKINQ